MAGRHGDGESRKHGGYSNEGAAAAEADTEKTQARGGRFGATFTNSLHRFESEAEHRIVVVVVGLKRRPGGVVPVEGSNGTLGVSVGVVAGELTDDSVETVNLDREARHVPAKPYPSRPCPRGLPRAILRSLFQR